MESLKLSKIGQKTLQQKSYTKVVLKKGYTITVNMKTL